jgi:hypothetical protein
MIWSLSSPLLGGSGRETDNREDPAEDRQRPRVDVGCPFWVRTGLSHQSRAMSALTPKADMVAIEDLRPLCATNGREQLLQERPHRWILSARLLPEPHLLADIHEANGTH